MEKSLGMYIHMHWGYSRPYSARTWTLQDWHSYATGLRALGYNLVMIWPMLEIIPDPPTESDIAHLTKMQQVIDMLKSEFGMSVLITLGPNVIGNERAKEYSFEERPYFLSDYRLDPGDSQVMDRFMEFRRMLFRSFQKADGYSIIDSDPGGWIGSTNEEFVNLFWRHLDLITELNPSAYLYYWMWCGWETYNRFWQVAEETGELKLDVKQENFDAVVGGLLKRPDAHWRVTASWPQHHETVRKFGIQDRALFYPYGIVEGEPTFPLTNWDPTTVADIFASYDSSLMRLGAMGQAQTHIVQLPHTYLVSHLAQGGTRETADLTGFADGLISGKGELIADGWTALAGAESERMRVIETQVRKAATETLTTGKYGGFLLDGPVEFLTDLAMMLTYKADALDLSVAIKAGNTQRPLMAALAESWGAWQQRTGFADAAGLTHGVQETIAELHEPDIDTVLAEADDWKNVWKRHGWIARLIAALKQTAA